MNSGLVGVAALRSNSESYTPAADQFMCNLFIFFSSVWLLVIELNYGREKEGSLKYKSPPLKMYATLSVSLSAAILHLGIRAGMKGREWKEKTARKTKDK